MKKLTRRKFLKTSIGSIGGLVLSKPLLASLQFIPEIDNPLDFYPDRDWKKSIANNFVMTTLFISYAPPMIPATVCLRLM